MAITAVIKDPAANITGDSTTKVTETPTILIAAPIDLITPAKVKPPKRIILIYKVITKVSIYIIFNEKTFN
jgi:hypothetical protein